MSLRVGLIGAGLIGNKRAGQMEGGRLIAVCDQKLPLAEKLASSYGAQVERDWKTLVRRPDIDAVIVSVSNNSIAECAVAALEAGKHVLVEKPAGRNPDEVRTQIAAAQRSKKIIRVGFNHRFHPAFQRLKQRMTSGDIGPLMYIRARYGHGGRVGYDREWRADPALSGGGELLDQGVHLIDLCRWLGGEFRLQWGLAKTFFWDMPVEDNGFLLLRSDDGARNAFLHASCTEWKNLFDFEVFGRTGKLEVWGLGRIYGREELRFYRMKPEMGPPEFVQEQFPEEDKTWQAEFNAFVSEIGGVPTDLGTLNDALRSLEIVYEAYAQSDPNGKTISQCSA